MALVHVSNLNDSQVHPSAAMQETETTYVTFTLYSLPAPQTFSILGFILG